MTSSVSRGAATPLFLSALTVYPSWGTFIDFLEMYGVWSCVFGAFTLLALPIPAPVLTVTWCRVAVVAVFYPLPLFLALVLGIFLLFKEILALSLVFHGYP